VVPLGIDWTGIRARALVAKDEVVYVHGPVASSLPSPVGKPGFCIEQGADEGEEVSFRHRPLKLCPSPCVLGICRVRLAVSRDDVMSRSVPFISPWRGWIRVLSVVAVCLPGSPGRRTSSPRRKSLVMPRVLRSIILVSAPC
jgi:hypothetical protein